MRIKTFKERLEIFKKDMYLKETFNNDFKIYGKSEDYEVPINEIPYWIENGWTFNKSENKMERKGRESVNVQQLKVNQL